MEKAGDDKDNNKVVNEFKKREHIFDQAMSCLPFYGSTISTESIFDTEFATRGFRDSIFHIFYLKKSFTTLYHI